MDNNEAGIHPTQPEPLLEPPTSVGAIPGSTAMGVWKIAWPLVAGGLVIGGGVLLARHLGETEGPLPPSYLLTPATSTPAAKAAMPEAAPIPKVAEPDLYEDALRPEGGRAFLLYCRDMDEVMNLKGIEELARKRTVRVPDSFMAWAVLGFVSEWRNDPEGARMACRRAKTLLDQDQVMARQPVQVRANAEMTCSGTAGIYFFCRNDKDSQFATCRKAVFDRPNDDGAWFVLGFTAASRQNFVVMALCADALERLNPDKARQFKEACIEPMKARMEAMRRGGAR